MRYVVFVRHGEDQPPIPGKDLKPLSPKGMSQVLHLSAEISSVICGSEPCAVISSTRPHGEETAVMISRMLQVCPAVSSTLEPPIFGAKVDVDAVLHVIDDLRTIETVVVVLHYEHAIEIPSAFLKRRLSMDQRLPALEKGGGCVIDCLKKTVTQITPQSL